ncbi:MAG: hypothetical protein JXR85_08685 [Deltaproteobacteria bacterium]|jgi:hypothetical protein|nr:hypothetical protein [Deltaproteobacteria bacterium]
MVRKRNTFQKRQKENSRKEKREKKLALKLEKKQNIDAPDRMAGIDPDIAGITPGPQPLPEQWHDLDEIKETAE